MTLEEKKPMEQCWLPGSLETYGKIRLAHWADPSSIRVTVLGQEWEPEGLDQLGDLIFSGDDVAKFMDLESSLMELAKHKDSFQLKAKVRYCPASLPIPRSEFDSLDGLYQAMENLNAFHQMLRYRKFWQNKEYHNPPLREFVLYGRYILTADGRFLQIRQDILFANAFAICNLNFFNYHLGGRYDTFDIFPFPEPDAICPICGKPFTISDIKRAPFIRVEGFVAHKHCSAK